MSGIPKDILKRLAIDFDRPDDLEEALRIVKHVRSDTLNVGWIQLIRSMIIISDGDIKSLNDILESGYMGDPRDVIMSMMHKPNSNNDHGLTPFKN
ncbi:MAG: hypothetical protein HRT58_00160 [Crocinitomicaceae bacterium]|nr:hypothetical protein [Flavobacteriales bacterium]NQZ34033.1 hypothetical protein [Crocinitomicaceae bacterium]